MEAQEACTAAATGQDSTSTPVGPDTTRGTGWADGRLILLLMLLVSVLRVWQISHTEVTSRDSFGYIEIAWALEHERWLEVLPHAHQHPGYPLTVLAVSLPVRRFLHGDLASLMQWSAQAASALASVLLIVPMYFLGRQFFERRIVFWAVLLFHCLPASGRVMADGLSEAVFLLWTVTSLLFSMRAVRDGRRFDFAVAGLTSALAYWTRPEGLLVVVVTGAVLVTLQLRARWRRPWKTFLVQGSILAGSALLLAAPFMWAIGGLTVKKTAQIISKPQQKWKNWVKQERRAAARPPVGGVAKGPAIFALWYTSPVTSHASRLRWALKALSFELAKGFFYAWWMPVLLGLYWFRDRFRDPGTWVPFVYLGLLALLLFRVAAVMGYLSERHLLLFLLCGSFWGVAALDRIGSWLAGLVARWRPSLRGGRWTEGRAWTLGLVLFLTVAPLTRTVQTLHAERVGFRQVGAWLAANSLPGDIVCDPYSWSTYYAGRSFTPWRPDLPSHSPRRLYIVLEESKNPHPHLIEVNAARKLAFQIGTPVHAQEVRRGKEKARLVVYQAYLAL